jgi:hypothetical protein
VNAACSRLALLSQKPSNRNLIRFCRIALTFAVAVLALPATGRPSDTGTLEIRFLGQCLHATDKARIKFSAYKPYGGGSEDARDIVLHNGHYSATLRTDYYLITLFMKDCVANFDAGVYSGVRRSIVVAPYPVLWRRQPVALVPSIYTATAESVQFTSSEVADIFEMPRSALFVVTPYEGLSVYLKDHSGKISTPITDGRSNYFDDVFEGDYTLVVFGSTELRALPIKIAGDFDCRQMRYDPRSLRRCQPQRSSSWDALNLVTSAGHGKRNYAWPAASTQLLEF